MSSPSPRIVVLGGGVAGLETALLLNKRLSGRVDLQLVSEDDDFLLRESLVYVPFGGEVAGSRLSLEHTLWRAGVVPERARVDGIDADLGRVHLADGRHLPYEHLVIATGAESSPQAVPGLREHAVSLWAPEAFSALQDRLLLVRGRAREGARQRVLLAVAPHNLHASALYEVALMLDTWLRREGAREPVEIAFVTPEASFCEAAGPRMHGLLEREFTQRGIRARAGERVVEVGPRHVRMSGGAIEPYDLLVTAPPHRARMHYEGLPADDRGFLHVEDGTRQVVGHPEIYAPGAAGDFPLKDTFLALLQADAAAHHLAATIARKPFERPFEPTSVQIIDMLDTAAYAQLPLETTGDPDHPVRLRAGADGEYKVGVSRAWRAAKRTFSSYLVMQFGAAEPFRAGPGWRSMELGVRATAGMLAD